MTRKTGAKAVKARQLTRAAKVHRYKQKLKDAGESLSLPKPSREAQRQKDAELKKLYLDLVSKKEEQPQEKVEEAEETKQVEKKPEQKPSQEKAEEAEQSED
jgi:hypothetical protein